ncbi:MAG: tetratricopeptide repeat protein [Methyloceanibacter sp.]
MNAKRQAALLPILVAALLFPAGCTAYGPSSDFPFTRPRTVADFEQGSNRPPTEHTLYAMARLFSTEGRDAECESVLVRCIQQYPHFMPAYCDLAGLYLNRRRLDESVRVLNAGLRVSPRDPILMNNLGMCMLVGDRYGEALSMFSEAAGIMPEDARYRANMAVALGMMGRYAEALSLYEQIVSSSDAHHNLAILREARND